MALTDNVSVDRTISLANSATIDTSAFNSSVTGVISGNANLIKQGGGTLSLEGVNSFKGEFNVAAGKVVVSNDKSLGDAANMVKLQTGTRLSTSSDVTVAQRVMATGDVTLDSMGNNSVLAGAISGNAMLDKTGTGSLSLTGINTFEGDLDVQAGQVIISNANSLGALANIVKLQTGTRLSTGSNVTVAQRVMATGDVTLDGMGNNSVLAGVISGNANLSKLGSGTLSLEGANDFVGNLSILEGTLGLATDANLGAASNKILLNNGTTLRANLATVLLNHDIDIIGVATADTSTNALLLNAKVAGGVLVKTGTGTIELANDNNAQSETVVNQGILQVSNNNNLGVAAAKVVLNGGIFQSIATQSYARDFSVGVNHGTVDVLADTTVTLVNTIDGAGRLNKTGTGVLVLAGNNSLPRWHKPLMQVL